MDFNPLVSIIIPVYNGADFLGEAIQSAINQTYNNIEIIVVNDGSNDMGATRKVALSFGEQIKYFEKENGGVSSAFNCGIRKMKGTYFSWLSHDDLYYSTKLEKQIAVLSKLEDKHTILYSNQDYIDSNSLIILKKKYSYQINDEHILLFILFKRPIINGNTVLINKECFKDVGYFNESLRYTQDYDMWYRLALKYPFYYVDENLIQSRIHSNQGSKTTRYYFMKESVNTKIRMLQQPDAFFLSISGEKNISSFLTKLNFKYILNGGDSNGWPVKHCLGLIKKKTKFSIYYSNLFLYYFFQIKLFLKLHHYLNKKNFIKYLYFSNEE